MNQSMVFNPWVARDYLPRFKLDDEELKVVEEIKLLGVVIRSDLCWNANTDYMIERAYKIIGALKG